MHLFTDLRNGLTTSLTRRSLGALTWTYLVCLGIAIIFTIAVFAFVSNTVGGTAMAAELRQGVSADWLIDIAGVDGTVLATSTLMILGMALIPAYLVLVVFCSGGIVNAQLADSRMDRGSTPTFLSASARFAGPMLRIALVEVPVIAIVGLVLVTIKTLSGSVLYGAGAWFWLVTSLFVLALVTTIFDFARIELVADDSRRSLRAIVAAIRFVFRNGPIVVAIVVVTLVVSLAVGLGLIWVRSLIPLDTGAMLFLGIVFGQISIIGRLWTRIFAYATEASVWQRIPHTVPAREMVEPDLVADRA